MKRFLCLLAALFLLLSGIACSGKKEAAEKAPAKEGGARTEWIGFDQAMSRAAVEKKFVITDYYTSWCKWCKVMDEKTYTDAGVVEAINRNFLAVKIDGESPEQLAYQGKQMSQMELTQLLKVEGFPTTIIMDAQGKVLVQIAGYIDVPGYLKMLEYMTSGAYQTRNYDDYLAGK
jgi:thioredoxin-related protein